MPNDNMESWQAIDQYSLNQQNSRPVNSQITQVCIFYLLNFFQKQNQDNAVESPIKNLSTINYNNKQMKISYLPTDTTRTLK